MMKGATNAARRLLGMKQVAHRYEIEFAIKWNKETVGTTKVSCYAASKRAAIRLVALNVTFERGKCLTVHPPKKNRKRHHN